MQAHPSQYPHRYAPILYFSIINYHHYTQPPPSSHTHAHVQAYLHAQTYTQKHKHTCKHPHHPQHTSKHVHSCVYTWTHTHVSTHTHLPWPQHTSHMYSQTSAYNTEAHTVRRDCHTYTVAGGSIVRRCCCLTSVEMETFRWPQGWPDSISFTNKLILPSQEASSNVCR